MRLKWILWKIVLSFAARYHGFPDPVKLVAKLNKFAQPSEVIAPLELLRAGAHFQARGLINSQVIQHNLDWIWPYWVERQFDPLDASFIPRAFSLTHINLTHRNWTATGLPGTDTIVLIDPRGLVTPFYNSWSVDSWFFAEDKPLIIPSRIKEVIQKNNCSDGHSIDTNYFNEGMQIQQRVYISVDRNTCECCIELSVHPNRNGTLAIAIRPYNPEGISFIYGIQSVCSKNGLAINDSQLVYFDTIPNVVLFSNFRHGDVFHQITGSFNSFRKGISCKAGMATAAALFTIRSGQKSELNIRIPLSGDNKVRSFKSAGTKPPSEIWEKVLENTCKCDFTYKRFQELYQCALYSLMIHTSDTVYAGPFTYKRFWFRDAAFIIQALLFTGKIDFCKKIVDSFFQWQKPDGYFQSQEGEWDSNGQALWSLLNYCECSDTQPPAFWDDHVRRGAEWIFNKQIHRKNSPYYGLFPSGFSAEHLGPNDYYYWDDFWGVAGLFSAASLLKYHGNMKLAVDFRTAGKQFFKALSGNINKVISRSHHKIIPASPNRRPDSSAVGNLVAAYPLQLLTTDDERIVATTQYLFENCCINNAFYHDISHSGINPYLSLHIGQTFLRNGDQRFAFIVDAIGDLASPTGQWPEAVHPQLGTGCMGDGQHIWAAAEWLMMLKNMFLREERLIDIVYLCSGITRDHILTCKTISFGPVYSKYGVFNVSVEVHSTHVTVYHTCKRNEKYQPVVYVALCGLKPVQVNPEESQTQFSFEDFDL
ncbi:MAG: hypothetical protein JW915_11260 [Chitinispirillaceae bacterium]|nr:hypothetical protein [Chitinispirillaceae bacterium]